MFNDFPMDQVVACVVGFTPLQSETPPGGFKDRLKWQLLSSMLQFKSKDGLNVNPSSKFQFHSMENPLSLIISLKAQVPTARA